MSAFSASWEEPVARDWHGFTVAKVGPWSQGSVLLQTMSILDAMDNPAALDPSTAEGIHAICESFKLAFADREAWYGEGGSVPLQVLLSTEYAHRRVRGG